MDASDAGHLQASGAASARRRRWAAVRITERNYVRETDDHADNAACYELLSAGRPEVVFSPLETGRMTDQTSLNNTGAD